MLKLCFENTWNVVRNHRLCTSCTEIDIVVFLRQFTVLGERRETLESVADESFACAAEGSKVGKKTACRLVVAASGHIKRCLVVLILIWEIDVSPKCNEELDHFNDVIILGDIVNKYLITARR